MTAPVQVEQTDTFDQWRVKTNTISSEVGNTVDLTTTDKTNVVAAVNETRTFSIAMAIALS